MRSVVTPALLLSFAVSALPAQGTRLLRNPSLGPTQIAFTYGGDLWVVGRQGGEARRITSTPAVEADPQFSPDGKWIAFTSNRDGGDAVYLVPVDGGNPRRLTWSPAGEHARGWTPDGRRVLFGSGRASAPTPYEKLWTIPVDNGPAQLVPAYMGFRGSFSPDGKRIVVDRVDRWDVEFRSYRGGQNTPLTITDVSNGAETRLPNERTMDIDPVWVGETIYFLSDRDWATNVWSFDTRSSQLKQLTHFKDADVKTLDARENALVFEEDGYLWMMEPIGSAPKKLAITVSGDFPWAASRWTDVTKSISSAALGPNGKRAVFEARGEIFTVPVEKGDARNLTRSSGAADRAPVWSPDGQRVAWFSDEGTGYRLLIGNADGLGTPRAIALGDAKMAWSPAWSPDGNHIAFVDNKVRLRVVNLASGAIAVADTGGGSTDQDAMSPAWSPDSKWIAYAKTYPNQFRRVMVWSMADGRKHALTDALASAGEPAWDANGRWLYFLASTDLGVQSGWADLGSQTRTSTSGVYVALLRADEPTPFTPESDEDARPAPRAPRARGRLRVRPRPAAPPGGADTTRRAPNDTSRAGRAGAASTPAVRIDFDRFDRRILALPMPVRDYAQLIPGASGILFVAERVANQPGTTLHKWEMTPRKASVFVSGVARVSASSDGKKLMWQQAGGPNGNWVVAGTEAPPKAGDGTLRVALNAQIDPALEWKQIFDEAWRMEHDYFYAPNLHGADWEAVQKRYQPLISYVKHRADLTYVLDMLGGELSVGALVHGRWRAAAGRHLARRRVRRRSRGRWRAVADSAHLHERKLEPGASRSTDAPGVKARVGDYLLEVNGVQVTTRDEPWKALDGTADRQTVLRLSDRANGEGAWNVTVVPVRSEAQLRQRAWVEDNRRRVDSLSHGTLAYVWIPNTSRPAVTAFDRYYYAQQDRKGAVIDERFNQGGLLDDYFVAAMSRKPVGGVTDFVPGVASVKLADQRRRRPEVARHERARGLRRRLLPVGVPSVGRWPAHRHAHVGWTGERGGSLSARGWRLHHGAERAVFGPDGFIAEGEGVHPDIEVLQDSKLVMQGRDPQLERAVDETMKLVGTKRREDREATGVSGQGEAARLAWFPDCGLAVNGFTVGIAALVGGYVGVRRRNALAAGAAGPAWLRRVAVRGQARRSLRRRATPPAPTSPPPCHTGA
jgi:tricorn protease